MLYVRKKGTVAVNKKRYHASMFTRHSTRPQAVTVILGQIGVNTVLSHVIVYCLLEAKAQKHVSMHIYSNSGPFFLFFFFWMSNPNLFQNQPSIKWNIFIFFIIIQTWYFGIIFLFVCLYLYHMLYWNPTRPSHLGRKTGSDWTYLISRQRMFTESDYSKVGTFFIQRVQIFAIFSSWFCARWPFFLLPGNPSQPI